MQKFFHGCDFYIWCSCLCCKNNECIVFQCMCGPLLYSPFTDLFAGEWCWVVSAPFTWAAVFKSGHPGKALGYLCQCQTMGGTGLTRGVRTVASGFTLASVRGLSCHILWSWMDGNGLPLPQSHSVRPQRVLCCLPWNKPLVYGEVSFKIISWSPLDGCQCTLGTNLDQVFHWSKRENYHS